MLAQLLIAEALCDAVAEGDAKSLGISEEEIVRLLDESSRELLPGDSFATEASRRCSRSRSREIAGEMISRARPEFHV